MPDDFGTPEMFKVPERYRAPKRNTSTGKVTWSKHRGPRETCAFCILDIAAGLLKHPLATATQVARRDGRTWHLCKDHSNQVKHGERHLPRT